MKKYILGAVIGAVAMFAGYALAATKETSGLSVVDQWGGYYGITKIYDADANVICYTVATDNGISCLKN